MLFAIGPLLVERQPFNVDAWSRETKGDWAKKDLLGRRPGREFVGEGEGAFELSGRVHPYHYGGLSEIELAHALARAGTPQFVCRGDGLVLGWYAIESVRERHRQLLPAQTGLAGVGGVIEHELKLVPVDGPGADLGSDMLAALINLFG